MKYTLRPYQKEAIEAILKARRQGKKRLLVCLPTGAGKTVIFSRLAQLAKRNVLILAHRSELLSQAREKIEAGLDGQKIIALEQANTKSNADAQILLCSIRSLHEERLQRILRDRDIGLIIYDECHHAPAEDNTRILRQLGVFDEQWDGTLLGFTATTRRGDGVALHEVFEEIVYSRSLADMILEGYLVPLRGYRISTSVDLKDINPFGEDFALDELAGLVDIEERNALVARSIQELARDRRTIIFCINVNHAIHLAKALNLLKHPTGVIHGQLKPEQRSEVLGKFRQGKLKALTNIGVLTEGFDDPGVSCIAMARPTRSSTVYLQCIGRGMRLFPEKKDCLILDFVDLAQMDLVTLPTLFGMPVDLNLRGESLIEAAHFYQKILFDTPGFEWEAGEITLEEIQKRAAIFDPLTLQVNPEIQAISGNAWASLGRFGVVLHFYETPKKLSRFKIVEALQGKGGKYQICLNDESIARFTSMEEAVEAVDYEISQMGSYAMNTALQEADWRNKSVPPKIQEQLAQLRPPRSAQTIGQAVHYLAFAQQQQRSNAPLFSNPAHTR